MPGDKTFFGRGDLKTVISPFLYRGKFKEAVKEFKFASQRLYGELFGKILAENIVKHEWLLDYDFIVPVPLHETRLLERGYNQSEILAKELSARLEIPLLCDILFRTRKTEHQSRLHGMERVENVREAFAAVENIISGKKVILVDDIYTMGETARACAFALKQGGAKEVVAVTLCITVNSKESTEI